MPRSQGLPNQEISVDYDPQNTPQRHYASLIRVYLGSMNPLLNLVTITNRKESTPVLQSVQGMPLLYTRHWRKVWLWSERRDVKNWTKQVDTEMFLFRGEITLLGVFFLKHGGAIVGLVMPLSWNKRHSSHQGCPAAGRFIPKLWNCDAHVNPAVSQSRSWQNVYPLSPIGSMYGISININ